MTPYKAAESNKCVENCGNNYLFKRHNSCYLDCQSIKTTRTVFIQEETKECVFDVLKVLEDIMKVQLIIIIVQ